MIDKTPFETQLELDLVGWAVDYLPAAVDAIEAHWLDRQYVAACCGRIFRRIVEQKPDYLYAVALAVPDQLLALSPYIREVQMPWGPMPGSLGWPAWIKALDDIASLTAAGECDRAELIGDEPVVEPRPKPVEPFVMRLAV